MRKRLLALVLAFMVAFTSMPVYADDAVQDAGMTAEELASYLKKPEISYDRNQKTGYMSVENEVQTPDEVGQDNDNGEDLPAAYQKYNEVASKYPNTRDQDPYGTCWAFAAVACGEFDLTKEGAYSKEEADFSELQLAYNMYHPGDDKLGNIGNDVTKLASDSDYNYLNIGGNVFFAQHILANWRGLVGENEVPYGDAESTLTTPLVSSYSYANNKARLVNSRMIDIHADAESVKRAIREHGAVYASYYHNSSYYSRVNENAVYNYNGKARTTNHAIAIVGWDDNYSKWNWFPWNRPEKNGAWLVRNSWGTANTPSEDCYFWMSYEDNGLADSVYMLDYELANNTYDNIYQHDGSASHAGISSYQVANVFTAENPDSAPSEVLDAVMVSMTNDVSARMNINVYTNLESESDPESGTLQEASTTSVATEHAGIYTFKLKNPVQLTPGEKYAIVITTTSGTAFYDIESTDTYAGWLEMKAGIDAGESFWKSDAESEWLDVVNIGNGYGNISVKGLTNNSEEEVHIHSFEEIITKATGSADGSVEQLCTTCGYRYTERVILKPTVELAYNKITYSGSAKKPKVTVTNKEGTISSASYEVTYQNNVSVGRAKVTVQLPSDLYEPIEKYFTIVPKAPASSNARLSGSYNKVKFSWETAKGATGYEVYYKKSSASKYTLITRTTGTSISKSNLSAGSKYNFKVVPYYKYNGTRYTALQSSVDSVYTLKKLDKPTVTKSSFWKVKVKWKNIDGESGYQISRSKKSGGINVVYTYATTKGNNITLRTARKINYYYRVRAYKVVDGKKIYGPWSNAYKYKLK